MKQISDFFTFVIFFLNSCSMSNLRFMKACGDALRILWLPLNLTYSIWLLNSLILRSLWRDTVLVPELAPCYHKSWKIVCFPLILENSNSEIFIHFFLNSEIFPNFTIEYPSWNIHTWAYACPPVFSLEHARYVGDHMHSVTLNSDVIPRLTIGALYDLKARIKIASEENPKIVQRMTSLVKSGGTSTFGKLRINHI